jgi:hypothetical protein
LEPAPTDQPRIRDGVVGRATRAGRDPRRTVAGEAGDAVDTRGLKDLGEGHRRQDGGQSPCQHRLARPRGPSKRTLWAQRLHHVQLRILILILSSCRAGRPLRHGNAMSCGEHTVLPLGSLMTASGTGARSGQPFEQRLGLLEVGGVKALGEPAINRR